MTPASLRITGGLNCWFNPLQGPRETQFLYSTWMECTPSENCFAHKTTNPETLKRIYYLKNITVVKSII